MRIVIDGACGSGKTTFLLGQGFGEKTCDLNIKNLGFTVISDLLDDSFNEGLKKGILPPKSYENWNSLFRIILRNGKLQYDLANNVDDEIVWYDRGVPYIDVISRDESVPLALDVETKIKKFRYDYVFVFSPVETFDLSNTVKGGFKHFTMEERLASFERTYEAYSKYYSAVYKVPMFSSDLIENFTERYQFICSIINEL